jgi:hypothetical protein
MRVSRISTDGEPNAELKLRAVLHYKDHDADIDGSACGSGGCREFSIVRRYPGSWLPGLFTAFRPVRASH